MKIRTITIAKKDIFFDVDAATHLFSRANEAQGLPRTDALESDTDEAFNKNVVTRFADRQFAELSGRLANFGVTPDPPVTAAGTALSTGSDYELRIRVEDGFQDELLEVVAEAAEKYVANGAIADWFLASGDAQGTNYANLQSGDLSRIIYYIVHRKFPARV